MDTGQPHRSDDPLLLVLASLSGGPKHGYAIMQDVEAFSGARLGPGTLYGAISRLERDGLIAPMAGDRRRRPYRLTRAGAEALREQAALLDRIVKVATRRLRTA